MNEKFKHINVKKALAKIDKEQEKYDNAKSRLIDLVHRKLPPGSRITWEPDASGGYAISGTVLNTLNSSEVSVQVNEQHLSAAIRKLSTTKRRAASVWAVNIYQIVAINKPRKVKSGIPE